MSPIDEAELGFEQLFRSHYAAVLAYVSRRTPPDRVEDAVAEIFLVAWRRRDRVPEDPLPWLFSVGRRVLSTDARTARRRLLLWSRLTHEPVRTAPAPASGESGQVGAALARLAPREREALMLIAWEGLTPTQAASVLGESPGAFRARLHRARRRMEALLAAEDQITKPSEMLS